MAEPKTARFSIPAVGAGASLGETNIVTPDDSKQRTVTGVFSTNLTKLVRTRLMHTGNPIHDIDNSLFSATFGTYPVNEVYAPGVQISLDIVNGTGGALVANADVVLIRYEI